MAERGPALELATLVDRAPAGDGWLHEIKFDGYRIAATIAAGRVTLWSRNGKRWTDKLAPVAEGLSALRAESATLDGEVAALDRGGKTSFQRLQREIGARSPAVVYYVFDLLDLNGRDLRALPCEERKRRLAGLLEASQLPPCIQASTHVVGRGPEVFEEACRLGLEGIVSKRAASQYRPGRGRDWVKVKCVLRQELVIGGFTEPSGTRTRLGALLVGVYEGRRLRYAGRVGTGFDARALEELGALLAPLERPAPAFVDPPRGRDAKGVHWVEPRLVAEVAFTEWTGAGQLRHPSYLGLRPDKPARSVVRERPRHEDRGPRPGPRGRPGP